MDKLYAKPAISLIMYGIIIFVPMLNGQSTMIIVIETIALVAIHYLYLINF